MKKITIFNQ